MDRLQAAILDGDLALQEGAESVGVAEAASDLTISGERRIASPVMFEGQDDHADLGGIQRCARPCRRLR
jgi:hypothetical protein